MDIRLTFLLGLMISSISALAQPDCPPAGQIIAQLAGTESTSYSTTASGAPLSMDVELVFIDHSDQGSWAADLAMFITSPNGTCIQFGGYDNPVDSNCTQLGNYLDVWPDWNTASSGTYNATVDLAQSGLSGDGTWDVTIMNGFTSADAAVTYDASWSFNCVLDTTPPTILIDNCPDDTQVSDFCGSAGDLSPEILGFPSFGVFDDICPGDVDLDVSVTESYSQGCGQGMPGQPGGSFTIERTFTAVATDCNGNQSQASCVHFIQVDDLEPPALSVECPSDVTITLDENCELAYEALSPSSVGTPYAQAFDACDAQVDMSMDFYDQPATDDASGLGFSFVRQWFITASDDCGNASFLDCSQTITVDPGGCSYAPGCLYLDADNYDPSATEDDGSCTFSMNPTNPCPTDVDADGTTDTQDLILLLGNFSLVCGE